MYLKHFGLHELPFGLTPDTSFFFASSTYQEALNTLLVAARNGEGFIKVTGEVGNGKTMLCRKFLSALNQRGASANSIGTQDNAQGEQRFMIAYIPNPHLEPRSLLLALAEQFRVPADRMEDQHQLLKGLTISLLECARNGQRALVCLDEAQAMPLKSLEVLRLLTNLETEKRKLLQVVLFGQPELDDNLRHHSVRQLRQRITFQHQLHGLSGDELDRYLRYRLKVSGFAGETLFTKAAVKKLQRLTKGTPRLVNIVAHKSLMLAYGEGRQQVDAREIDIAAQDTPQIERERPFWYAAAAAGVIVVALVAWWWVKLR